MAYRSELKLPPVPLRVDVEVSAAGLGVSAMSVTASGKELPYTLQGLDGDYRVRLARTLKARSEKILAPTGLSSSIAMRRRPSCR